MKSLGRNHPELYPRLLNLPFAPLPSFLERSGGDTAPLQHLGIPQLSSTWGTRGDARSHLRGHPSQIETLQLLS